MQARRGSGGARVRTTLGPLYSGPRPMGPAPGPDARTIPAARPMPHPASMHRVRRALVTALLGAALLAPAASPALAASEFPPGYEGFYTYAEMVADISAV